jgi:hypothetical protein
MRSKHLVGLVTGSALALVLASAVAVNAAPKNSSASKSKTSDKMAQQVPAQSDVANSAPSSKPEAEQTVSDKIQNILASASKADRILSRKGERQAVDAFYQKRSYAPLWVDQGKATSRAEDVLAVQNLGVLDFVLKPNTINELAEILYGVLFL